MVVEKVCPTIFREHSRYFSCQEVGPNICGRHFLFIPKTCLLRSAFLQMCFPKLQTMQLVPPKIKLSPSSQEVGVADSRPTSGFRLCRSESYDILCFVGISRLAGIVLENICCCHSSFCNHNLMIDLGPGYQPWAQPLFL